MTKDKKFLVISSNTKEDSEILVLPRGVDLEKENPKPTLLIRRQREVRAHIDHVRDFFVTITNVSSEDHSFKVA